MFFRNCWYLLWPDLPVDMILLYILFIDQLLKIGISHCEQRRTCQACVMTSDPVCGWCNMEGRLVPKNLKFILKTIHMYEHKTHIMQYSVNAEKDSNPITLCIYTCLMAWVPNLDYQNKKRTADHTGNEIPYI